MSEHTDFEELERIPWASLAVETGDPRIRLAAVGVLIVLAIGVAGWWLFGGGDQADATVAPVDAETTLAAAPIQPATTASPPSEPTTYSEADLMLIDLADEERLAVLHAEWLVRDYLTVDSDPQIAERIDSLLPGVVRSETSTYVEWTAPIAVTSPEPGRYRVEVLYRVLKAGEDGFVRQPAGALAVEISIDVDGTAWVETLPEEVSLPPVFGIQ